MRAQPVGVALRWQAPAQTECATRDELIARIARITNHAFVPETAPHHYMIVAEVNVEAEGLYSGRVVLSDSAGNQLGSRSLDRHAPSCRSLDISLGVIIATMLDQLHREHASLAQASDDDRVALGGFMSAATAFPSHPFFGMGLEVTLPLGIPLVIDLSTHLPAELVDDQGRGARLWSLQTGVSACPARLGPQSTRLHLCLGLQGGGLWARGVGLTEARSTWKPLVGATLEPKLLIQAFQDLFARVSLVAGYTPIQPTIRWEIAGEGTRTARAEPFMLILRVGVIGMLP